MDNLEEAKSLWDTEVRWCRGSGYSPRYYICVRLAHLMDEEAEDVYREIKMYVAKLNAIGI